MELASVEEEYNVRLDTNLDLLVSNFSYLLRASTLTYEQVDKLGQEITVKKNKFNVKQEKLLIDGTTANIIKATESLLTLTSELRQSMLLNDFKTLNENLRSRAITLENQSKITKECLKNFKNELEKVCLDLEVCYSESKFI